MGRAPDSSAGTFASLLRQLRAGAGLTQEELAAAATLSPRSISDLERGINLTARAETARLLADALALTGTTRAAFEAAARGVTLASPPPAGPGSTGSGLAGPTAATRTLPSDTSAFTGREPELRRLMAAVSGPAAGGGVVSIYAIGGMAGVGKTTFAVHAAHQLAAQFPDGQIFVPLHAHTPGHRPVGPAEALASMLLTAGIAASQIPAGLDERARLWRDQVAGQRLLLVLDDAAGHDQVRPLLPGAAGSLVLVTSRRHLTALDDTRAISLDTLPPPQAAELLILRAARPGLRAEDAAVAEITRLCGYLPLAIGMLARQLHHHPAWSAAQVAAELATARDRLGLMRTENLSVAAAFDLSYQDLGQEQQRLFRRLGLHPGTDIDAYAAAALDGTDAVTARRVLDTLYDQHLLTEPARGRYRLHDLMREHARALAATDPAAGRDAALLRLRRYYLQVATAADRHLSRRAAAAADAGTDDAGTDDAGTADSGTADSGTADAGIIAAGPAVADGVAVDVPPLPARPDAMAWMDAERVNLHAVISHAAEHGDLTRAGALAAALHAFLRFGGHWDQALTLQHSALEWAQQAGDRRAEAIARSNLGDLQIAKRDTQLAAASLTGAVQLFRDLGDRPGEAGALTDLAAALYLTGRNRAAADHLARAHELFSGLGDRLGQAVVLSRLGSVQLVTGDYPAATAGLSRALELYRGLRDQLGEAHALTDLGAVRQATGDYPAAAASLGQALPLYRALGDRLGAANALLVLGGVRQATGDYVAAATDLRQALELYRELGDRLGKANVLSQLGAVAQATGDAAGAAVSQEQALDLYRELGDRAGEAEALTGLAELLLTAAGPAAARLRFEQARVIAADIGWPLGEAGALHGIGRCDLLCGKPDAAAAALRAALTIYQRIGSPAADGVRRLITDLR